MVRKLLIIDIYEVIIPCFQFITQTVKLTKTTCEDMWTQDSMIFICNCDCFQVSMLQHAEFDVEGR